MIPRRPMTPRAAAAAFLNAAAARANHHPQQGAPITVPYIITTLTPNPDDIAAGCSIESRRAVATLEEARERAQEQITDANYAYGIEPEGFQSAHDAARSLPEAGGTIGPLPDGTVIEVERADWLDLYAALDASSDDFGGGGHDAEPHIIDAFNAAQA